MKQKFRVVQLVQLSLLAAVSYVLMFFSFPILPFAPFLKLDFSDLPILIGTILFGPIGGVIIALIKVLLYWVTFGASLPSLIGVFASFAASISMLYPIYFGLKKRGHNTGIARKIMIVIIETITLVIVLGILNLFLITPLYINLIGLKIGMPVSKYVLSFIVPFNVIKGIVIGGVFMLINGRLIKRLK